MILENDVNLEIKTYGWYTALYIAALNGHLDILKLLIEKGADVNTKDNKGKSALDVAKTPEVKALLIKHGAKTSEQLNKESQN